MQNNFIQQAQIKFRQFQLDCANSEEYQIAPLDGCMNCMVAVITGPLQTVWSGSSVSMYIWFPESDFNIPPKCYFYPVIYHPNVDLSTGKICLNFLSVNRSEERRVGKECRS